jgi:hypothetical protein
MRPAGKSLSWSSWSEILCILLGFEKRAIKYCGSAGPSKKKKETSHGLRTMEIRVLTSLRTFACTDRRKTMLINLDRLEPYEGNARDERP